MRELGIELSETRLQRLGRASAEQADEITRRVEEVVAVLEYTTVRTTRLSATARPTNAGAAAGAGDTSGL